MGAARVERGLGLGFHPGRIAVGPRYERRETGIAPTHSKRHRECVAARRDNLGMKEYERAEDEQVVPERLPPLRPGGVEAVPGCTGAPWLHAGVRSGAKRLACCDAIKRAEAKGKSALIDAFSAAGIPKGAHRALDSFHDPVYGLAQAVRKMGVKDTLEVWCPHMLSDVLTPMSLPLPGTCKAGVDSLRYKLYARGLVNVRSVVLAPLLNVVATEALVRADVPGRLSGERMTLEERRAALLEAHAWAAVVSLGLAVLAFSGTLTPAVVAYASTATWSAIAAGGYYIVEHKEEIRAAVGAAVARAEETARAVSSVGRDLLDAARALKDREPRVPLDVTLPSTSAPAGRPSAFRLGLAAALLALALSTGGA